MSNIILILIISLLMNIFCDFYIYKRIIVHYFKQPIVHKAYIIISALIISGLVISLSMHRLEQGVTFHRISNWIFFIYFIVYTSKLIYSLVALPDYPIGLILSKPIKWFSYAGITLASLFFISMLSSLTFELNNIQVKYLTIESKKLPISFDNYRIVQFSDFHIGNITANNPFVKDAVEKINSQNPDIIVFTGDLVSHLAVEVEPFIPILSRLKAKDGVYFIMGNHDYGDYHNWKTDSEREENLRRFYGNIRKMGWIILNNESVQLKRMNDSISLIGTENWGKPPFKRYADLKKAMSQIKDDNYKILLTHNPQIWDIEVIPTTNIDLTLSGHTHAMQMVFPGLKKKYSFASLMYDQWQGLYEHNGQYINVNTGLGYVLLPMRFGVRPEITVIDLKPKHE